MRTAVQNVPKVCLAVANPYQRRSKREVRQRISPCMDFAYWTTLKVCLAVANPNQRRSSREIRQRISPCTDFAYWTIGSFKVCIVVANPYQRRSRIQQRISQSRIQQRISHAWIMSNWTKPITIDAHIVVNAPEPAITLQHLNNLGACSQYQTPDVTRCVQVHFDAEFCPSSEDDVSSRPAKKTLTPSPVAAPESPFHSSRADAEIKFQVRQLLIEDHSPIFLNSLQGGLHIHEALCLFLGAGSHWQTRPTSLAASPRLRP